MGGKSSSESSQSTTTETNNASLQNTSGFAAGSVKATNLEVLDAGAIQSSFDFAKETQAGFGETFESVLGIVEKSIDSQGEIVGAYSQAKTNEETKGIANMVIPLAVVSVVGLIGYKLVK